MDLSSYNDVDVADVIWQLVWGFTSAGSLCLIFFSFFTVLAVGLLVQGTRSFTTVVLRLGTGTSVISALFSFTGVTGSGLSLFSTFLWLVESGPPGDCISWAGGGSGFAGEFGPLFGVRPWKESIS